MRFTPLSFLCDIAHIPCESTHFYPFREWAAAEKWTKTLPLPNENIATSGRKHCCFRMKILPLLTVHRGTAPTSLCHYFSFATFALGFTKVQGSPLDPSTGTFFFWGYIFYYLSISYTIIDFSGIRWMGLNNAQSFWSDVENFECKIGQTGRW